MRDDKNQNNHELKPDKSAILAWKATEAEVGLEEEITGRLPLDHVPVNAVFSTEWQSSDDEASLEDIPDADEFQAGTPVDPAVPDGLDQHGTDLLNGVGGVDDEHDRQLPKYF